MDNLIESSPKKPNWLRVRAPNSTEFFNTQKLVRNLSLNTICEEAACPNIGECWSKKHATIMILGSVCTRACTFCNIVTGNPSKIDLNEPERVAKAIFDGFPVTILQNVHALVQTLPKIIIVACFLLQHSPIFGHAASSQIVFNDKFLTSF
jgi:hypothetical protein